MSTFIHPTAQLAANVRIGENVIVGPFCVLGFPGYQLRTKQTVFTDSSDLVIGNNVRIFSHTVVCQRTIIHDNCRIDSHCYIGEDTVIGKGCVVEYAARIYDNVSVENDCIISGFVSNDCIISHHAIVHGELIHKYKDVEFGVGEPSPIIESFAFIGRKAIVIGNVVIAKHSYVGAGAIITKSTKENRLYIGAPAVEAGAAPSPYANR
jgi:UDP-2-acetamido-3-amino-2,3-dideoxy-glucuronate N-acetyltransferase